MRKTMLLVFLSYLCAGSMAQTENDYLPFLEEGKSWVVKYMIQENSDSYIRTYIVKGDTIIDGKQYKKLYEEDRGLYIYALREEGQKIYSVSAAKDQYGNPNKQEYLWYDFGVSEGDVIDAGTEWLYITGTDYVYANGCMRKRIHIYCTYKKSPDGFYGSGVWVEGIGSDYGPYIPHAWAIRGGIYMEECAVRGQIVFNYSDFTAPAWEGGNADLEAIHIDLFQPSGSVFDLQGRRLTEKPSQPGIYIQNGRKVVIK